MDFEEYTALAEQLERLQALRDEAIVALYRAQPERTIFSFQIARRSAQLEPSVPAPWTHVLLDSFADLVASKMVALVERGAPRDFRDVHTVCQAGLITPHQCWELWRRRQQLAGSDTDCARARLAVETHLARIARPSSRRSPSYSPGFRCARLSVADLT